MGDGEDRTGISSIWRISIFKGVDMVKMTNQIGLVQTVAQCIKDAEGTIEKIKEQYPDCALTLSIGEKSEESYRAYREAGADRYLLRHETADPRHYMEKEASHE